jgi:hypothetical protein
LADRPRRSGQAKLSLQLSAEVSRTLRETGNVIADMDYRRGTGFDGEESVEIRHTESLGRRHIKAETRVIEGAGSDPTKPRLNAM